MSAQPEKIQLNKDSIDLSSIQVNAPAPEPAAPEPAPTPAPEAIAPVVIDDPVEKRKLILTIENYYASHIFGKCLAKFPRALEEKSIAELENVLKDIKFTVANVTSGSFVNSLFGHTIKTIEKVSAFTNLDLTGLNKSLCEQDETFVLLEEIRLEHQSYTYTRPEYRLAFLVARTALAVNAQNKLKAAALKSTAPAPTEKEESKLDAPAPPELLAELKKLDKK